MYRVRVGGEESWTEVMAGTDLAAVVAFLEQLGRHSQGAAEVTAWYVEVDVPGDEPDVYFARRRGPYGTGPWDIQKDGL